MTRMLTGTAVALMSALAVTLGYGREGGQNAGAGRKGVASPRTPTIEQVTPGLYAIRLPNPGPTVVVRVTGEGVILVDDMNEAQYDPIIALVKTVTPQPVKYVISTHHHADHTGGNVKFLEHAQILMHKNARAAMVGATPLPGRPPITYTTEAAVHLGGAEVQLHHVGRGHTNGDTIVYFPDLRIMAAGDLFFMIDRGPVIDYANGGTAVGWLSMIDNILKFDFDTVIPGHGPVSRRADLVHFKERFATLQARTRTLIRQGVGKDQYLTKLEVGDLGWSLDPSSNFVRMTASGFYDELANAR